MESRTKLLGHAIHPMLIVFPLGLLTAGVAFDIVYLFNKGPLWASMAYWMIAIGVVGGLVAALFGFIDWLAIPAGTRAKAIGVWHALINVIMIVLFIISWVMRDGHAGAPPIAAQVIGFFALAFGLVSSWLGGELVERLGVGIDDGAHLNAPNSLAHAHVTRTEPQPPM